MSRYTWEFQKSFLRKIYNKEVNDWFKDTGNFEYLINTPRNAVKSACLIKPNDTQTMALIKMTTFRELVQKTHDKPAVYGIPVHNFKENYSYQPQITVHFRELLSDAKLNNRQPLKAQSTIRFKGSYNNSTDIDQLKNKIKQIFVTGGIFKFKKGRDHYYYRDPEKGYNLHCNADTKSDAVLLFNAMLSIQDDGLISDDYLGCSQYQDKNWSASDTKIIGGQSVKKPKLRPIGMVQFTGAEFDHYYLKSPLELW